MPSIPHKSQYVSAFVNWKARYGHQTVRSAPIPSANQNTTITVRVKPDSELRNEVYRLSYQAGKLLIDGYRVKEGASLDTQWFSWKKYLPQVERDIKLAEEEKQVNKK